MLSTTVGLEAVVIGRTVDKGEYCHEDGERSPASSREACCKEEVLLGPYCNMNMLASAQRLS